MKLHVTNSDWQTKKLVIKDKTKTLLKNGMIINSASAMLRQAYKAGR